MPEKLLDFVNTYLVGIVVDILIAAVVLFVGLKLVKFFTGRIEKLKFFKKMDSNIGALFINFLRVTLNVLIVIAAIEILGVPSATIIATLGSCGLAIGLALQGGLSNLAGGVMIMIFKPFHHGDYIYTKEGEGFVEEIGIFYTKLATFDKCSINIPNSLLSSTTVKNLLSKGVRGIDLDLSVAYGTDIAEARRVLLECARRNPLVLPEPTPKVAVIEHADSSVKLLFRVFVKNKDYWQVRAEMLEASLSALADAGLEIPFPQVDVHMR